MTKIQTKVNNKINEGIHEIYNNIMHSGLSRVADFDEIIEYACNETASVCINAMTEKKKCLCEIVKVKCEIYKI